MRNVKSWTALIGIVLSLPLATVSFGQGIQPDLSLAREVIRGQVDPSVTPPADDSLLATYPMQSERPLPVLAEVPGQPFRQVEPMPQGHAWWKYPFYVALGLPRDLADSAFGALSYVPLISPTLVYIGYEVVPTQWVLRDPRDLHRWAGRRNRHGHGMLDSESWGWFPSAHRWHFTYDSKWKQRRNQAYNEKREAKLAGMNRRTEEANQAIANHQLEARRKAYEAIGQGDGTEAARRMMPYRMAYPLDEGAFTLFVTSMALYYPDAPDWARAYLWQDIDKAQSRSLTRTSRLLADQLDKQPSHSGLNKALIYIHLVQGEDSQARDVADAYLTTVPDSPDVRRLALETALTDDDPQVARQMFDAMDKAGHAAEDWDMIGVRLALAEKNPDLALDILDNYDETRTGRADLNYYLGLCELLEVGVNGQSTVLLKEAFDHLEQAVLTAETSAMRARVGKTLGLVRAALVEMSE